MADIITIVVEGVKPQYSMLQQFGRCYCQVADGMATTGCFYVCTGRCYYHVADGLQQQFGRCYCQVADAIATTGCSCVYWWIFLPGGRWNSYRISYFNFSSGVLSRTSSHMCGIWYLPMFLLRDGLLTLMYNASFIHLLRFWSSLPTMLKFSMVTW